MPRLVPSIGTRRRGREPVPTGRDQVYSFPLSLTKGEGTKGVRGVERFTELYGHRTLRLHPLKGDRAGKYAMVLSGNYRLIIERISEDTVRILGVEDYHGD